MQKENGKYVMSGGFDPSSICERYGGTTYVYDSAIMKRQYDRICNAFGDVETVHISFACKALTNISVLRYFRSLGAHIDCVSLQEVQLALRAGFAPKTIIFTPSGVGKKELLDVADLDVRMNIDSVEALEFLGQERSGYPLNIRIRPNIMAGGNEKISVGHDRSKFGIPLSSLDRVHAVRKQYNIKVEGIHIHTGSDIYAMEVFKEGAKVVFEVAQDFPDLDFIDFGGGFKVPYKEGDKETDMETLGPQIATLFNDFCKSYGRPLSLVFEPGKFLVSQCGYLLSPVNNVKEAGNVTFAHLDTGLNHLIRPMFYDAYHHIVNVSNPSGQEKKYDVVGYICETDTFAEDRLLHEVREGDILAFYNAGAYCFSMSSNYNARLRPAEVMILDGKDHLIRERESMADILRNQIEIKI